MSTDYAAKEREFLDSLKSDTGRDLSEWMEAIRAQALPHRNDIIDWLRQQGFMFSRASWLERIHNNGGRPIYAEQPATRRPPTRTQRPFPKSAQDTTPPAGPAAVTTAATVSTPSSAAPAAVPVNAPRPFPQARPFAGAGGAAGTPPPYSPPSPPAAVAPAATPPSQTEALSDVLARAKAFRPLAQYLLREIEKAVPGATTSCRDGLVVLANPHAFAVVLPTPKDVRLGLDLGERPAAGPLLRAKIAGAPSCITHMLVLDDARQLDAGLADLIKAADASAKARSAA